MDNHLRRSRTHSIAALALTACLVLVGLALLSAQEGVKETEQFIKAGEKTSESVAEAKLQMQTTLTNYSELLGKSATDMKDSYKKLVKNIKETDEKIADAREHVVKMQETGKTYFDGRAATVKKIQDPALQAQAQERLTASQRGFDGVLTSLRQTRESLDPVRKELGDQVKYPGERPLAERDGILEAAGGEDKSWCERRVHEARRGRPNGQRVLQRSAPSEVTVSRSRVTGGRAARHSGRPFVRPSASDSLASSR